VGCETQHIEAMRWASCCCSRPWSTTTAMFVEVQVSPHLMVAPTSFTSLVMRSVSTRDQCRSACGGASKGSTLAMGTNGVVLQGTAGNGRAQHAGAPGISAQSRQPQDHHQHAPASRRGGRARAQTS